MYFKLQRHSEYAALVKVFAVIISAILCLWQMFFGKCAPKGRVVNIICNPKMCQTAPQMPSILPASKIGLYSNIHVTLISMIYAG